MYDKCSDIQLENDSTSPSECPNLSTFTQILLHISGNPGSQKLVGITFQFTRGNDVTIGVKGTTTQGILASNFVGFEVQKLGDKLENWVYVSPIEQFCKDSGTELDTF